jgi:D-lactate dehydrogenase
LPETPETHHIINKDNVRKIKKGCVLINTARGGLIETEAILIGLKEGIFSACGLDVLEEECVIKEEAELLHETFQKTCDLKTLLEEHILIQQPNVLITPHNAFNSSEALIRILDTTIDNINAFLAGVPKNKVT